MPIHFRIISGGQTGVDRAALDAALECGMSAGGWCPGDRRAEDGRIADHYPLIELPGAGYSKRTRKNVIDSDATLIIYYGFLSGGTALTRKFCIEQLRPYLLIDAVELTPDRAARRISAFIERKEIVHLNVAGPRHSTEPRAYSYAKQVLLRVLKKGVA